MRDRYRLNQGCSSASPLQKTTSSRLLRCTRRCRDGSSAALCTSARNVGCCSNSVLSVSEDNPDHQASSAISYATDPSRQNRRAYRLRAASCALPASEPRLRFLFNPLLCILFGCEAADVFHLTIAPPNPNKPSTRGLQRSRFKNRIRLDFIHSVECGVNLSRRTLRRRCP